MLIEVAITVTLTTVLNVNDIQELQEEIFNIDIPETDSVRYRPDTFEIVSARPLMTETEWNGFPIEKVQPLINELLNIN